MKVLPFDGCQPQNTSRSDTCIRRACVPSGYPPSAVPTPYEAGGSVSRPPFSVYAWFVMLVSEMVLLTLNTSKLKYNRVRSCRGMILLMRASARYEGGV